MDLTEHLTKSCCKICRLKPDGQTKFAVVALVGNAHKKIVDQHDKPADKRLETNKMGAMHDADSRG